MGRLHSANLPNEFLVLGGAAVGTLLIAAPGKFRSRIVTGLKKAFSSASISTDDYLNLLKMQFEIYTFAKRNGVLALEPHLTKIESSDIFKKYPSFLRYHHASDFFVDALRQVVNGTTVENVEMMLDLELDTHHEEQHHAEAPGPVRREVEVARDARGFCTCIILGANA